jgi:cobalamin biosynthesis protein CobD/CbiB
VNQHRKGEIKLIFFGVVALVWLYGAAVTILFYFSKTFTSLMHVSFRGTYWLQLWTLQALFGEQRFGDHCSEYYR